MKWIIMKPVNFHHVPNFFVGRCIIWGFEDDLLNTLLLFYNFASLPSVFFCFCILIFNCWAWKRWAGGQQTRHFWPMEHGNCNILKSEPHHVKVPSLYRVYFMYFSFKLLSKLIKSELYIPFTRTQYSFTTSSRHEEAKLLCKITD